MMKKIQSKNAYPLPRVILEGTHLTNKTDIAFAVAEHRCIIGPRSHRYHIPLVSAEWETISDAPPTKPFPRRSIINFEPHEEARAMEIFETWTRLFELQPFWYWVVDRFHISTQSFQKKHAEKNYSFEWLEKRLETLDFHLVLCTRKPETFEQARAVRLEFSETPSHYDDLQKFIDEQELMRELVRKSHLKTLELDVSDKTVAESADKIIEWMADTGGLWHR